LENRFYEYVICYHILAPKTP